MSGPGVRPTRFKLIHIGKGLAYIAKSTRSRRDNYNLREDWEGSPLHETGFLHIKGIKSFGYEIVKEKESEKNSKFSKKKKYCSSFNYDRKDSSWPVWMTEQLL